MLKGKSAIVTGSTSGIGLGIAHALANQGANILLNGFGDIAEIGRLTASFRDRYRIIAEYSAADMEKPAEIELMVQQAHTQLGSVDILVNNAGIQFTSPVESFPAEKWDQIIAINLSSSFHSIRAVLPQMRARNWGRIINIASVHGLVASSNKIAYVAAKHGVIGITKGVALETAHTGITCNAICPGWVLTPLVQNQIDDLAARENIPMEQAKLKLVGEKQPSMEFVTPEQIGGLVQFLCSPAANQIRGASMTVDGGWTSQ